VAAIGTLRLAASDVRLSPNSGAKADIQILRDWADAVEKVLVIIAES
jgi:hypothetical protein